jgi:hypothetical protein
MLVLAIAIGDSLFGAWYLAGEHGDRRAKHPLYGIWEVRDFTRNDEVAPPLLTDSTRWRFLVVDHSDRTSVHAVDDHVQELTVRLDTTVRQMLFATLNDSTKTMAFSYATPDSALLRLVGAVDGDSLEITLRRIGPEGRTLVDRRFRWIIDLPAR